MLTKVLLSSAWPMSGSAAPVLTIGNFDGVHRGHCVLLRRLVERARAAGRPAMVFTFEPAPTMVLAGGLRALLPVEEKIRLLGALGADVVCVERFTRSYAARSADWFARVVLGSRLRPAEMVVGYDFKFGHGGQGERDTLRRLLPGMPVEVVDPLEHEGRVVSSSRIRSCLQGGRVAEAGDLLGRPHSLTGTVVRGDRRGRVLGFPTANLLPDDTLVPAHGVYAVRAGVSGGPMLPAVANLGVRPTTGGGAVTIEVHLLVPPAEVAPEQLYGEEMQVCFVQWMRGEERFPDLETLRRQIARDSATARDLLDM